MKIQLSNTEADKIILKKIVSLQKIKKKIKVDRNGKFISVLFQRLEDIKNITMEESDFFEDNSQLEFSLYVDTNATLSLFSNTLRGCNYGINTDDNSIDSPFYEIKNETEMKNYFHQLDVSLPNYIEIVKLNFTAKFENTTTYYNFINDEKLKILR
ncbi:hypothetical protein DBR28_04180 [Chryseobacterium sp. HMWF028]|nr:hypothetical protein DBR28_04180 [Chryseobacterium sp. HMWF028]